MSERLSDYQQRATAQFSSVPWIVQLQEKALADFTELGFPHKHLEDWKYTSVDAFLQQSYTNALAENGSMGTGLEFPLSMKHQVQLNHGHASGFESLYAHLPEGVVIQPLSQAFIENADLFKPYLNHMLSQEHGFHALNTAMLRHGLFIYIPTGVSLPHPLLLSHWQDQASHATYLRHVVVLEKDSSASLIEDYQGAQDIPYFTNTITEVYLAEKATLVHYKLERESKRAFHTGHVAVKQAAGSQFDSHSFSFGGQWVRSDISIHLQAPEAQCTMNGVYAPAEGQHIDHHTTVTHAAPHCRSEQDYKGILSGQSQAVFNGRVIVEKDAQHTQAQQQNKNLLLSKKAEVYTKPQLEIFADDVSCTHGATVGQLDEDALFYLATRGIGRAEANRYLIQAFAIDNLRKLTNERLRDWIGTLLTEQVG
jgi:Fe-S cluster assembly protein SufD